MTSLQYREIENIVRDLRAIASHGSRSAHDLRVNNRPLKPLSAEFQYVQQSIKVLQSQVRDIRRQFGLLRAEYEETPADKRFPDDAAYSSLLTDCTTAWTLAMRIVALYKF